MVYMQYIDIFLLPQISKKMWPSLLISLKSEMSIKKEKKKDVDISSYKAISATISMHENLPIIHGLSKSTKSARKSAQSKITDCTYEITDVLVYVQGKFIVVFG